MIINFIGNFQKGYVGEEADQVHLAREMENLGHTVQHVPQDIWKACCEGGNDPLWQDKLPIASDINIITKWHHFTDGSYIGKLREASGAPVFYWVWDYMWDMGFPTWHKEMVNASDLYIGNDVRCGFYTQKHCYYFPFDVADGELPRFENKEKLYDVAFFGSHLGQGDRIDWLTEINQTHRIKIFSWNYEEWVKRGFDAEPAVYGVEFMEKVAQCKVILGFSVNPHTWGYWSNRVGKVLLAGGFLLYQYAPGMELFLRDGAEYFSSIGEATDKIAYYLREEAERERIADRGLEIARERFTSKARVADLMILIERYLKKGNAVWSL